MIRFCFVTLAFCSWLLLPPTKANTKDLLPTLDMDMDLLPTLSPIQLKNMFNAAVLRVIQETTGAAFGQAEARQHRSHSSEKTDEHSHTHEHLSEHKHKHESTEEHLEEHEHSAVHKHMHVHDHYHDHNHHHQHEADHEAVEDHKHAHMHKHKYNTVVWIGNTWISWEKIIVQWAQKKNKTLNLSLDVHKEQSQDSENLHSAFFSL